MKRLHNQRAMRGFSLIEILIVTSITLTVSAVAIPKMFTTLANVELRSSVHSAAGMVQQTRMLAIKDAKFRKTKYNNGTGGGIVYIDLNDNGVPNAIEPQAQMGATVLASSAPTGIAALGDTELGFTPVTTSAVGFNAIGLPCSAWNSCAVGMVMYFTDTRRMGAPGWSAVSVSPAGRVVSWIWSGSDWAQL